MRVWTTADRQLVIEELHIDRSLADIERMLDIEYDDNRARGRRVRYFVQTWRDRDPELAKAYDDWKRRREARNAKSRWRSWRRGYGAQQKRRVREALPKIRALRQEGLPMSAIAAQLGWTKNAVIGVVHRDREGIYG